MYFWLGRIGHWPFLSRIGGNAMRAASAVRARIRSRAEQRDDRPDCFTAACQCATVAALQAPLPSSVPQIAIYTKTDGIVHWRSCINDDAEADVEVSGTHVGLAWNRKVYRIIGERLAELG